MAGLDTRGFADGAIRGFGLVDAYYDKEEDRARRDAMDTKEDERYERTASRQDKAFELQKTNADRNYGLNVRQADYSEKNAERNYGLNVRKADYLEKNADRNYGLNVAQLENTKANQAWQRGRTERQDSIAAEDRQRTIDFQDIQQGWQNLVLGVESTEKEKALYQKYPNYNPERFLDPQVSSSIDYIVQAASQVTNDDELFQLINTPDFKSAFGAAHKDQLNKGDGDEKTPAMFVPMVGEDGRKGFGIDLSIKGKDGKYNAPLTNNRSADPNDTVKFIPLDQAIAQIREMSQLNEMAKKAKRIKEVGVQKGLIGKPEKGSFDEIKLTTYDEFGNKNGEEIAGILDQERGVIKPYNNQPSSSSASTEDATAILNQADQYASEQVSKQAGLLTSDGRDFAQFGGDRNKAYQFYRNQYLKDAGVIQPQSASLAETLEAKFGKR